MHRDWRIYDKQALDKRNSPREYRNGPIKGSISALKFIRVQGVNGPCGQYSLALPHLLVYALSLLLWRLCLLSTLRRKSSLNQYLPHYVQTTYIFVHFFFAQFPLRSRVDMVHAIFPEVNNYHSARKTTVPPWALGWAIPWP
jgi:hypothetical protein